MKKDILINIKACAKVFWKISIKKSPILFAIGTVMMLNGISQFHFSPTIYDPNLNIKMISFLFKAIFFMYAMIAFLWKGKIN